MKPNQVAAFDMSLPKAFLLLISVVALAACQTTREAEANRPGSEPVQLETTLLLVDSICGASRPDFATAQTRMQREGLTVVKDGRNFSPTIAASAAVTQTPEGRTLCAVRTSFAGNLFTLDKAMSDRFGPPRTTNQITPPSRYYDLGAKGNLVLIIRAQPGRTVTTYDLGYVQGL